MNQHQKLVEKFADYDNQFPRYSCGPESSYTRARRVIRLAKMCGIELDPWERKAIELSRRTDRESMKLLTKIMAIIVSRQNGKGEILVANGLDWLFLSQEELVLHSAHQMKTVVDSLKRLKAAIKRGPPELDEMVGAYRYSHGNEGVEMRDGREYKFIARSGGSGRGFPAKKLIFDEAYDITETEVEDILPTLASSKDGQAWFTSSAVHREKHPHGRVLSRLRWQGIRNSNPLLGFNEWSIPEEVSKLDYGNKFWWKFANPGWDYRPDMDAMLSVDFSIMNLESFGQEHLGVGLWFPEDEENKVISQGEWNALEDPNSRIIGKRVFTLAISPYGRSAAIGVAGLNQGGYHHVEVIKQAKGTHWVVDYLKGRCETWRPICVFYDPRTATAALEHELQMARVPLETIKGAQVPQAFSEFYDRCVNRQTVRHPQQPSINEALLGAEARDIGEGTVWDVRRSRADLAGLVAITNALWGFTMKTTAQRDPLMNCW